MRDRIELMIIPSILLETSLWEQGFVNVAGVDEAGRGPLAGPVTAGAVMVHGEKQILTSVRDSKKMSEKQRETAFDQIKEQSSAFGIGIATNEEIDQLGIENATQKAMLMALEALQINFKSTISYVIVDGSKTKPLQDYPHQRIKSGDAYHYSIAAASVLAKVTRDRIMKELAKEYPQYGFENHVGYGTKLHLEALRRYGPCSIHRKSFAPVRVALRIKH